MKIYVEKNNQKNKISLSLSLYILNQIFKNCLFLLLKDEMNMIFNLYRVYNSFLCVCVLKSIYN